MKRTEAMEIDTASPIVRLRLKARVYEAGYPTFRELADELEIHHTMLSKVLNGHEFPSPRLQRNLAEQLGLTLRELKDLL